VTEERGPAVDVDALSELERSVGDDREFLRDLVETYLDDAPKQLEEMRAGLALGNVESVNRAAHTLKSNSASLGALILSQLCRELEALTAPATTESADMARAEFQDLVTDISAEFDRVMTELDSLVPVAS
jgi:HPt (histidine-containing phosphotransfer) domain-containing protein